MKTTIWISFDLGIRGDYPTLYAWLDDRKAKECGDGVAVLRYEYKGELVPALKKDLAPVVKQNLAARIYLVRHKSDLGLPSGTFIIGRRRAPAWSGFGTSGQVETDE